MAITNAQLAQQISELLSYWRTRDVQFRDWLSGTADGGPYGDGTYPLTDYLSQTFYVKSPARLQQDVDGLVNSASSYASTAQSAASAAQAAQAAAETARDLAASYRVDALAYRDAAIEARLGAENAAVNALGAATNAAASAAAALQSEANAALSETNAAISEANAAASADAAAASAAAAATFNPALFAQLAGATFTGGVAAPAFTIGDGSYTTSVRDYSVTTAAPKQLLNSSGAPFTTSHSYRVTGSVLATGTHTGAQAIFFNEGGTWKILKLYERGVTSNHVEFFVDPVNGPSVRLWNHASTYTVRVFTEELRSGGSNGAAPWGYQGFREIANVPYFGATQISLAGHTHGDSELTSLAWAKLTGVPSTFPPSAHTHSAADITSGTLADARLSSNVPLKNSPNTFTNNVTIAVSGGNEVFSVGSPSGFTFRNVAVAGGWARGLVLENSEGTRLAGIGFRGDGSSLSHISLGVGSNWWESSGGLTITASAITWKGTALSLAGHTHVIADVAGLQAALADKLDEINQTNNWNDVTNQRAKLIAGSTNGPGGAATYFGVSFANTASNYHFQIAGRNNRAFMRTMENGAWGSWHELFHTGHLPDWSEIAGKPSTFTPSAHTHSASDITSGTLSNSRLSGVLAHQGSIGWGANLNTYTTTGIWHQNSDAGAASGTNYPVGAAGMLRVYADDVMVYQEYFAYGVNATYIRKHYNGAWQAWHQVYDSGHKPSLADLGAAAANHTHSYLPLSGGEINGGTNSSLTLRNASGAQWALSLKRDDNPFVASVYNFGAGWAFNSPLYIDGRGGVLHYGDTFVFGRVFVRNGGGPVGNSEGDITIIW